jgi:hypothetical protein
MIQYAIVMQRILNALEQKLFFNVIRQLQPKSPPLLHLHGKQLLLLLLQRNAYMIQSPTQRQQTRMEQINYSQIVIGRATNPGALA